MSDMKRSDIHEEGPVITKLTDYQEMYDYAREHKLGWNMMPLIGPWLQRQHFKVLAEAFIDGEYAESAFFGKHTDYDGPGDIQDSGSPVERGPRPTLKAPSFWRNDGYYAYAVTNENRLIYTKWRPLHHTITSIPMNDIKTIEPTTHIIWGYVKVESLGENFSIFWTKNVIKRIAKVIQQGVSEVKNAQIQMQENLMAKPTEKSLLANLQDAQKALEQGILTEEEYNKYKAKLLNIDETTEEN
jgi:hypothetical protein